MHGLFVDLKVIYLSFLHREHEVIHESLYRMINGIHKSCDLSNEKLRRIDHLITLRGIYELSTN